MLAQVNVNGLFSIRVTEADFASLTKATVTRGEKPGNRSQWIREAIDELLHLTPKEAKKIVRELGGAFGEKFTVFVPVILPVDVATEVTKLADTFEVRLSQIVRAAVRRRFPKPTETNARRR